MNWSTFYLVCFAIGLASSVLSLVGGAGHLHLGHWHMGHWHFGHGHANAAHGAHGRGAGLFTVNGLTITVFLCWFGGIGYLLAARHGFAAVVVLILAGAAGLAGAAVLSLFLTRVLLPHERELRPEDTEMRGVVARVSSPLRSDGLGEILFSLNGTRRATAARTEDGRAIARDAEVLVTRYARGVAWVRPFSELDEELAGLSARDGLVEVHRGAHTGDAAEEPPT